MILDDLVTATRQVLARRQRQTPAEELQERIAHRGPALDLAEALGAPGVSLVAEIKRASPSAGDLQRDLEPDRLALTYANAGADAVSVLTEPTRFHGQPQDLIDAARALRETGRHVPVLRKDFVFTPYQLLEARAWGADAVLLIVAILDDAELASLYDQAQALGLTALVEVHDEAEAQRALALKPRLVGINNRNLHDFSVDLGTTERLRDCFSADTVVVSESGIRRPEQVRRLAQLGVDAVLVGEALVTAPSPVAAVAALKEAGR